MRDEQTGSHFDLKDACRSAGINPFRHCRRGSPPALSPANSGRQSRTAGEIAGRRAAELPARARADEARRLAGRGLRRGRARAAGGTGGCRRGRARSEAYPQRHRRFQAPDARRAAKNCSRRSPRPRLSRWPARRPRGSTATISCARRSGRWRARSMRCRTCRGMSSSTAATGSSSLAIARR